MTMHAHPMRGCLAPKRIALIVGFAGAVFAVQVAAAATCGIEAQASLCSSPLDRGASMVVTATQSGSGLHGVGASTVTTISARAEGERTVARSGGRPPSPPGLSGLAILMWSGVATAVMAGGFWAYRRRRIRPARVERIPCRIAAGVSLARGNGVCTIEDITERGARLRLDGLAPAVGERADISCPLFSASARVRWADGAHAGVQFENPLSKKLVAAASGAQIGPPSPSLIRRARRMLRPGLPDV